MAKPAERDVSLGQKVRTLSVRREDFWHTPSAARLEYPSSQFVLVFGGELAVKEAPMSLRLSVGSFSLFDDVGPAEAEVTLSRLL